MNARDSISAMITHDGRLTELAFELGRMLRLKNLKLATAESCTGGWVAKCVTDIAGSSDWFDCAFIAYSNAAKIAMLDVQEQTLATQGAVSEAVVREMVAGALAHSRATVAVAVSGIAGPNGGSAAKPVGSVWIGWAWPSGETMAKSFRFAGGRESVRRAAVEAALEGLLEAICA